MSRDDIIRMAREALVVPFFLKETNDEAMVRLQDFAALVAAHALVQPCCQQFDKCQEVCMPRAAAAERNKVAQWMIAKGYATGHGDTVEDLLQELEWQIAENWTRGMVNGVQAERKECVRICCEHWLNGGNAMECADAIRARGQE